MIFEFFADAAKLSLIVACLYCAIWAYARRRQPSLRTLIEKRRIAILMVLVLAVTGIKLGEDVLGRESGQLDELILTFIHAHVPGPLTSFFEMITLTGSLSFLLPLTTVVTIALLCARRRLEALLLAASVLIGAGLVYLIKTAVGRARPALWETDWYWGFSFPSGHTLVVAAFATAAVIGVDRIWPGAHEFALWTAILWILLVGLSRLVIGVHWPTDVLAAVCIGAFLPLALSVAFEVRFAR